MLMSDLTKLSEKDVPWFNLDGQEFKCKVIDVYDGDTVTIMFLFEGKPYKTKCRLLGIDTAEIRRSENDLEKEFALKTRDHMRDLVLNKIKYVKCGPNDKFGRLLVTIYDDNDSSCSINDQLVESGYAYKYDGKCKKKVFSEWHKTVSNV